MSLRLFQNSRNILSLIVKKKKKRKKGEVLCTLCQITHMWLNEQGYVTLYSVMKIIVENGAKMTENGSIMVEIITILTNKNVNKQNFATRQFDLNLNRT